MADVTSYTVLLLTTGGNVIVSVSCHWWDWGRYAEGRRC